MSRTTSALALRRLAWIVVWYVGAVILLGAVVRVTGSGAGCGKYWPTCQGEVFHLPRHLETLIELSHRVTSALSLFAVVVVVVLFRKQFVKRHPARSFAEYALLFVIIESLIGAVLVLFGLVVGDRSLARAVMVPVHLANASLLMGSLVLAAHFCDGESSRAPQGRSREATTIRWVLVGLLATSMLGAVTALGDTLFPPNTRLSLAHRLLIEESAPTHFLEKLRIIHPLVATATSLFALKIALFLAQEPALSSRLRRTAWAATAITGLQLGAGCLNVWLGAPAPVQILHLGLALLLFCLFVRLWADSCELSNSTPPEHQSHQRPIERRDIRA